MKLLVYFILFVISLLAFGYIVYLNRSPVEFVLTPDFEGIYYRIPPTPLGLLVVGSFLSGFALGYIFSWLSGLFKR